MFALNCINVYLNANSFRFLLFYISLFGIYYFEKVPFLIQRYVPPLVSNKDFLQILLEKITEFIKIQFGARK